MLKRAWQFLHQPRVWLTVEPVLFLYMFATFLSYNTLQVFLKHTICNSTPNCTALTSNHSTSSGLRASSCSEELHQIEQEVQTQASHWLLYLNIASGVPSILVSLFYGGLSDQLGRKLFIVLPVIGTAFNAVVILLVIYFSDILSLYFLLVGSLVSGVLGNFSVVNFAVYSYASDVSAETGRTRQIGVLESMTYLGGTLSLVLGGLWITKSHSFSPPFWCVIGCEVAILVYVTVALPESWKLRRVSTSSSHNRLQSLFKSIVHNLVGYFNLLFTSWRLAVLMIMYFVVEINFLGISDVVIFYSLGEPLCWSPTFIGYFLALKVFLNGMASLLLLPLLSAMGLSDTIIILLGLASGASALIIMGLATHTWMMFLVPVIGSVRGCVEPCVRSMLSKTVEKDKKGVLFSGVSVLQAVCTLVASVIYNSLYPATREINRGLCFFIMSAALILPFILTILFSSSFPFLDKSLHKDPFPFSIPIDIIEKCLHIGRNQSGKCCRGNNRIPQESDSDSAVLIEN